MTQTTAEQTENINNGLSALLAIVGTFIAFVYLVVGLVTFTLEFVLASLVLWVLVSIDPTVGKYRKVWDRL